MSLSTERKRTKGEIACAECRRLKARCDKQVPCSTCINRGCHMLCPNSTVPPGESSRFVSAAEEFLRRKITKMEERIHSLEDALAIVQGNECKPHPLSSPTMGLATRETQWTPDVDRDQVVDNESNKYGLVRALGSLYIHGKGRPSDIPELRGTLDASGSESLLPQARVFVTESSSSASHAEEIDSSYLPPDVNLFHQAFPLTPPGIPTKPVQDMIESYLPPLPRATALCETFFQSIAFIFHIVSRQHILGELIPTVYGRASSSGQTPAEPRPYGPHDISLLFIVFAIAALMDSSLPSYNVEGQHYHVLSRASLCLQPVLSKRSMVTIKALNLMSVYNGMCGLDSKLEESCSLLNLAGTVALQIGFHKDPSIWGITGREEYERRKYFWELVGGTLWQSLISGRPPVIMPSMIACHIPIEKEENIYQAGETPLGFGVWCFSFTIECVAPVVQAVLGTRRPSYDAVLQLDKKIREFSMPQASSGTQTSGHIQDLVRSHMRESTLLFLHRGFFAQALTDFPWDPLGSPLRQSFLTAYQSAIGVLSLTRRQFMHHPLLYSRVWRVWTFAFLAAVIIATVAIHRLPTNVEPEPFGELDLACKLFHEAAHMSIRAQMALPILLRLREEAMQIRLETLQMKSGNAVSWDAGNVTTWTPRAGSSSSALDRYTQAPVLAVNPPFSRITELDGPYGATPAPLQSQSLYREIQIPFPARSAPQGFLEALCTTHSFAHGISSEESFVRGHSGTQAEEGDATYDRP